MTNEPRPDAATTPAPTAPAPTAPASPTTAPPMMPPLAWGVRPPTTQADLDVAEHPTSHKLAVGALVLCVIPVPLTLIPGIILAVVVLSRGRRRAGRGFGMAVGALGAAALWMVVAVGLAVWLGVGATAPAQRANGATGELVDSGRMDPTLLQVTDCLDVPSEGDVLSVRAKPCTELHDGEVYSSPALSEGAYPGEDAVVAEAERLCVEEFRGYVGVGYDDSVLEMVYLYPHAPEWESAPWATCIVVSPEPMTGTLRLAKR